ncbi:MAG: hypothetical protein U9R57_10865 [Thermodesulfobacteriota bacterium]|nr:hypothetical protein [Thermodesulfobacteriota bacterium]
MLKKMIILIVLSLLIAVGGAQAQVSITYSSGKKQHFTMNIADDWLVNVGSGVDLSQKPEDEKEPIRVISAMPGNGMPLWFGMWVPEELVTIQGVKEYVDSLGLELLDDVLTKERKFDTLNSMEVLYVSGTGKKEGEAMDFYAAFVQLAPESVAIAIYIGPPETTSHHGKELVQMVHSLQPVIQ